MYAGFFGELPMGTRALISPSSTSFLR